MTGYIVIFMGVYMLNGRDHLSGRYQQGEDGGRGLGRHSLLETRQSMSLGARLSMESDSHLPLSATPGTGYADHRRSFSGGSPADLYRSPTMNSSGLRGAKRKGGPPLAGAGADGHSRVLFDAASESRTPDAAESQQFMLHSGSDIEEEDEELRSLDGESTTSRTPVSPSTRQTRQYGSS